MKPFPIPFLLTAALAAAVPGAPASAAGGPSAIEINPGLIDELAAEAQDRNPALQEAGARVEAANDAASAVRTWDDPAASLGVWTSGPGGYEASAQGNLVYGIEQKLPLHGRPELTRTVATANAVRERFAADYETLKLRRDLEVALLALALAGRQVDLAREDVAWLDANVSAVDHRYRVGQATQVDWLKAQTARVMAGDDLATSQEMRDHSAFAINRLLNRDLHAAWPTVDLPALQPPVYYTERLVAAALESEPQLRVMRQESVSAQASADLTHRTGLPDVSVGLQAWQYTGDGALKQAMATVSFSVPWLNRGRYDSDWKRDKARKRASDLAAEDYALSLREELHQHLVDLDSARRVAVLYRGQLIPLTEQTLASAQSAWGHGLGTFQDILDAHRLLVADQRGLVQALAQQATLLADLCLLTGSRDRATIIDLGRGDESFHDNKSSAMP
jgi:outer membrane protein TolC